MAAGNVGVDGAVADAVMACGRNAIGCDSRSSCQQGSWPQWPHETSRRVFDARAQTSDGITRGRLSGVCLRDRTLEEIIEVFVWMQLGVAREAVRAFCSMLKWIITIRWWRFFSRT